MAPTANTSYVLDFHYKAVRTVDNTDISMDPKMSVIMRFQCSNTDSEVWASVNRSKFYFNSLWVGFWLMESG